jgi:hypothetical protein
VERIVLYAQGATCQGLAVELGASSGHEVLAVGSPLELARAVIQSGPVLAAVVCVDPLAEAQRRLLLSLKRSFPLLNLCLVTAADQGSARHEGWALVDSRQGAPALARQVRAFVATVSSTERRERPRFDWPLRGRLASPAQPADAHWQDLDIWALSADGAFLEAPSAPPGGLRATLVIRFQNSQLTVACEVLDPRRASSRLPAGFAVRFLELSEASRQVLERIVEDALLAALLQPEPARVDIPTLGEEELSIGGFEPL